jgi:circadian clock protein KaiB
MGEEATARLQGEREAGAADAGVLVLRLYVTGSSPLSARAVRNVSQLCEQHLRGRYDLRVIDLYQEPWLARDAQLVAAPTLIKVRPLPARRFIGSMRDADQLLAGLGVEAAPPERRALP